MFDSAVLRQTMVKNQLQSSNITHPAVLHAFATVPREAFITGEQKSLSYSDACIYLHNSGFMLPPALLAQLTQSLKCQKNDRLLVISNGSAYAAAILGYLSRKVTTLASDPEHAEQAEQNLAQCRIHNVEVVTGPAVEGWNKNAPYNAILIEGMVENIPETLFEQLAENGKIVAILQHKENKLGTAYVYERINKSVSKRPLFEISCPRFETFQIPKSFRFT